ncbi:MAG: hypothetical protein FWD58_05555 [Firmicutes bacterium]|nr:hypothetical protein [Bacillota bacterium]
MSEKPQDAPQNYDSETVYDKAEKATAISKCGACGANLVYRPDTECLSCSHCGNQVGFASFQSVKLPFSQLLAGQVGKWTDTHVFQCSNCGAKEILSRSDIAKSCGFCGTSNVVQTQELSGLKPNAVLPFKLTKESAIERVIQWTKRKFFAPRRFKNDVSPEDVDGVYNPAFTFDTATVTRYEGRLGKTETYTVMVNGKPSVRTKTVYFNISGTYAGDFRDVLIHASSVVKPKDLSKIQPFDTAHSKHYSNNYLFGFVANQYEKDGRVCWDEAKKQIDARIKAAILRQYTYTTVQSFRADTSYNNLYFSYLLLPVYIGHCDWRKKVYNFFVNGSTGKVSGKTPVSPVRVGIVAGLATVLVAAAIALAVIFGNPPA